MAAAGESIATAANNGATNRLREHKAPILLDIFSMPER
jgi:hypothetical protein